MIPIGCMSCLHGDGGKLLEIVYTFIHTCRVSFSPGEGGPPRVGQIQ